MPRVEGLIEQLYRERYVGFRNALTPVVGSRDAARDVVQEAFARALRDSRKLRREESLAAWVWRIALRIALRERGGRSSDEVPDDLTIFDAERDPALAAAIRSLPPKRRLILFLRYYADFTYGEIAEAVGVAEGTVAATLSQAHAALLNQFDEQGGSPVITDADGLLIARFAATRDDYDDADWNDVLRRRQPSRDKHVRALIVAVAVIAVGVPTAIAFGGVIRNFFFGTPAPRVVEGAFDVQNQMRRMMQQWQKSHGVHLPALPQVDVAKAHGVIAVKTRDGLLFLWAAPARDGRQCWFIDFAADINHRRAIGGGSCDAASPPASKIQWSTEGSAAHPTLTVFSGRVYVPATAVVAKTGKTKHRVMVVGRYFLAAFPRATKTPTQVTAIDAHGNVVASSTP